MLLQVQCSTIISFKTHAWSWILGDSGMFLAKTIRGVRVKGSFYVQTGAFSMMSLMGETNVIFNNKEKFHLLS